MSKNLREHPAWGPIPLKDDSLVYARPDGGHYHVYRECSMLQGKDFDELEYKAITFAEAKERKLWPCSCSVKVSRECALWKGRNQVLYLLLCIGDENVAHDNYHPDVADILYRARVEICKRLKYPRPDGTGVLNMFWPQEGNWPDFEKYTYTSG